MSNKYISVIIANYNNEPYLEKCLSSIIAQTHKYFEVIIVDDASTDNSLQILNYFADKDDRIQIISNENNLGVAKSINKAISLSSHDYLLRHDPDDYFVSNGFEVLLTTMSESGADIVSGQAIAFGSQRGETQWPTSNREIMINLLIESPIHQPTALVKKSVFSDLKYKNVPSEDYDLWLRALSCGFKFANASQVVSYYRRHSSNLTSIKKQEIFHEHIPVLRKNAVEIIRPSIDEVTKGIYSRALTKEGLDKNELTSINSVFEKIFYDYDDYSHQLKRRVSYYWMQIILAHGEYRFSNIKLFLQGNLKENLSTFEKINIVLVSVLGVKFQSPTYERLVKLRHSLRNLRLLILGGENVK